MSDRLHVDIERRYRNGPSISASFELRMATPDTLPETLVLFGPSGSGKTTILRCIAGLERPDAGTLSVGTEPWFRAHAPRVEVAPQRRRIGYLPQGFALFPHLSVRQNLAYAMDGPRAERDRRVDDLLAMLDLTALGDRRPGELSGGQQQRVGLGRALGRDPVLLLLDEPLASLDAPTRAALRLELRRWLGRLGTPAIVVTHDRTEAIVLGDRIGVMIDGRLRQIGSPEEVFDRPLDAEVAAATGVETIARGRVESAADGLIRIRVGDALLTAVADVPVGDAVVVSIRPEDVLVVPSDEDVSAVSARNHLPGILTSVDPMGPLVRLGLDCGFPLVAYVTRRGHEESPVPLGGRLTAMIKAPAIHVIAVHAPSA